MSEDVRRLVIDTSVFMSDTAIDNLINTYHMIIPYVVLEELDNLKENQDSNKSYNARKAIRFVENNYDKFEFVKTKGMDWNKNDDRIIETANFYNCAIFTNDLNMKVKCRALGMHVVEVEYKEDDYKGYKVVKLHDEEIADFYSYKKNNWEILTNQYLLLQDKKKNIVDKYVWDGKKFKSISYKSVENKYMGKVKPLNIEQELLFDMLQNKNIKIKLTTGRFGSGKDYVMLSHAINLIENNKFDKLVWIRNNIEVDNSKEVGFLPGSLVDKILPFSLTLADHLGGQDGLNMMIESGKIELQHLGFIRGRDIKNSILYVSEAENISKEHAQLIMSRVGDGSILYMNGDFKQVDKDIFRQNSGLKAMIDKLKGHNQFGYVQLEHCERSDVAKMADLLD